MHVHLVAHRTVAGLQVDGCYTTFNADWHRCSVYELMHFHLRFYNTNLLYISGMFLPVFGPNDGLEPSITITMHARRSGMSQSKQHVARVTSTNAKDDFSHVELQEADMPSLKDGEVWNMLCLDA